MYFDSSSDSESLDLQGNATTKIQQLQGKVEQRLIIESFSTEATRIVSIQERLVSK